MKLQTKKLMVNKSVRVKALDFHSEFPWILTSLYSGTMSILDYQHQNCLKTFDVSSIPVRTGRFIPCNFWAVAGSDDMHIHVYNYNTGQKIKKFEAHSDFIRHIVIHPSEPYIISCSDDGKIKIFNYQKDFALIKTFSQHTHFVMQIEVNPRDTTKLASGSLDKLIKIWNIPTDNCKSNFSLGLKNGHTGGINCISHFNGDKPIIASGADDKQQQQPGLQKYGTSRRSNVYTLSSSILSTSVQQSFQNNFPFLYLVQKMEK